MSVGDYVTRGTKVATVMRVNPLRVELTVPAQFISAVAVGRPVTLEVDSYPGQSFSGQVRYVSPGVRADSRALVVEAVVPNAKGLLKPGLFVTARIEQGKPTPAVLVPAAAVVTASGTSRVFVVVDDHVEERIVTTGQQVGDTRRGHERREAATDVVAVTNRGEACPMAPRSRSRARQKAEGKGQRKSMQALAALCVRRPVFASVLILSLVVVGTFALTQLGVDLMPNIDIPTITVTTRLPGAAPEQVESEITDKVEEAVNTISGIDQLSSNSAEGISQVVVSFLLEKDADMAAQEVRDRVNRILPLLPRTITQPTIEKQDPDAQPIFTLALTADKPIRDVTEYADKVLRRRLESADGVGQVLVLGGRNRQINVELDAERLRGYNLTVNDVARALQSQNVDVPGGQMERGAQSITMRTLGRVRAPRPVRRHRGPRRRRPPGARLRRGAGRRRHGRGPHRGERERRADGAAADPQAVGHQHRGRRAATSRTGSRTSKASCPRASRCASSAISPSSSRPRCRACRST